MKNNLVYNKFIIRRSSRFSLGYIVAFPIILLFSCPLFFQEKLFISIIFILIAFAILITGILGLKDRNPQIILDEHHLTLNEIGQIPWNQIRSVKQDFGPLGLKLIILEVYDSNVEKIKIQVQSLDVSAEIIYELISKKIAASH